MALNQFYHGRDPKSSLNSARLNIRKAIDINRDDHLYLYLDGTVEIVAAQWELRNRRSPLGFLKKAKEALNESLKLNSKDADSYIAMAVCNRLEAEWQQLTKKRASDAIRSGFEMSERALSIKAENPEALAIKGALYLLRAQEEQGQSVRIESARNAQNFLKRALQKNPFLKREYEPFLKQAINLGSS